MRKDPLSVMVITNWKCFLFLNLIAFVVYFGILLVYGFPSSLEAIILTSPDAQSYFAVGKQLFGIEHDFVLYDPLRYRPFLFPLILKTLLSIGNGAFWFFQFSCWILVINGLYISIHRYTQSKPIAFLVSLFAISNAGLIGLTLHGLTEIFTLALLSCFFLVLTSSMSSGKRRLWVLGLASALTVVRPVFIFLVGLLLLMQTWGYLKNRPFIVKISPAGRLLLALSPIIIQLGLMWFHYQAFFISEIGSTTFRNHLAAQVLCSTNSLPLESSRDLIWSMRSDELFHLLLSNPLTRLRVYTHNMLDNFWSMSYFVNYPDYQHYLTRFSLLWNQVLYILLFISILILLVKIIRKDIKPDLVLFILFFVSFLIILPAGISFGEGDRLTTTAIFSNLLMIAYAFAWVFHVPSKKI